MTLKNSRYYVTPVNFNRVIYKRRRCRIIDRKFRGVFNVNTLNRLPLQINLNHPFTIQLLFGSSFR
jgi:hypothetical protein